MIIEIKNEFVNFKVYPSASVFVEFKKEVGKSVENAVNDPDKDQVAMIAKLVFLGHKSYCRLKNEKVTVNEDELLDSLTLSELVSIMNKFMGVSEGGEKKT